MNNCMKEEFIRGEGNRLFHSLTGDVGCAQWCIHCMVQEDLTCVRVNDLSEFAKKSSNPLSGVGVGVGGGKMFISTFWTFYNV